MALAGALPRSAAPWRATAAPAAPRGAPGHRRAAGPAARGGGASGAAAAQQRGHTPPRRAARARVVACRAAAGEKKQLPIFPLSVVALPSATVPLMIFEARYRVLFNTLLAGAENVDEGLVQQESPFAGSRRFGMCYVDEKGRMSTVGTTLEIQNFVLDPSGRMYVTSKGLERFRVTSVIAERPVMLCEVEVLPEDDPDASDEAKALAGEVGELFRNVLRLHVKVTKSRAAARGAGARGPGAAAASAAESSDAEDESMEPLELTELGPRELSYWIAHAFTDSRYTQQALLEEDSTMTRLGAEKELLAQTLKYYTAATALEGVFSAAPGGGGGGAAAGEAAPPPAGGPD
ncbi:Lonrf1 [Scenedesmus sp. PABB004]|nr:Lonrf1 [Scenedesmus sp. PABB004]